MLVETVSQLFPMYNKYEIIPVAQPEREFLPRPTLHVSWPACYAACCSAAGPYSATAAARRSRQTKNNMITCFFLF